MCGIVGVLLGPRPPAGAVADPLAEARGLAERLLTAAARPAPDLAELETALLGLGDRIDRLVGFETTFALGCDPELGAALAPLGAALDAVRAAGDAARAERGLGLTTLERCNRLEQQCRDLRWRLDEDLLGAGRQLAALVPTPWTPAQRELVRGLWPLEYALRNIDRLEIRGRDSAGVALFVTLPSGAALLALRAAFGEAGLAAEFARREALPGALHGAILGARRGVADLPTLAFVYKVAAEIGAMGQNVRDVREAVRADRLLRIALQQPGVRVAVLGHTRWASNGIINVANAHPQGDDTEGDPAAETGLLVVVNGDVDNYPELLEAYARRTGRRPDPGVTTDAKIVPLLVEQRRRELGGDLREAFRRTLLELRGSFAIALQHVAEPGRVLLGIGGSGQSLYVGLRDDALVYASELYGVVEATAQYLKLDGERERVPGDPTTRGQLLELSAADIGTPRAVRGCSFDGEALPALPVQRAQITTRDIHIGAYPHFFLKEIHESVASVRNTLAYRFELDEALPGGYAFNLDESAVPADVLHALRQGDIRRIYFIGQGTAAIAAWGAANYLKQLVPAGTVAVEAVKATELSGHLAPTDMRDCLVVPVSQSGTTTDTNRTVDIVRQRGARVVSIVNRRNSDLVFKSDGVLFTSSGRDVEMSVASTKAFYAQIVAGDLLALYLAQRAGWLSDRDVVRGLGDLRALPAQMQTVLELDARLAAAAETHALRKRHWAVVGSGPNQIAAHEIRIKLSELCYKSIACDLVEDKKHIDLSSEPLVIVCSAGLDEANLNDSIKEVAIFRAHRSVPLVVASAGAERFAPYAEEVFAVPEAPPHLAPVLSTMAGHLFGYHAACAIHAEADALRALRHEVLAVLAAYAEGHTNLPGEQLRRLDGRAQAVLRSLCTGRMDAVLEVSTATTLTCLLHELLALGGGAGERATALAAGSPTAVAAALLDALTRAVGEGTRPIDAIKHQAKTVTVGISRPTPTLRGAIGQALAAHELDPGALSWRNLSLLLALEPLVQRLSGATLYRVEGLRGDGRPGPDTRIRKVRASGLAAGIPSRTEHDAALRGTKWLVLKDGAVFVGTGRRDGRPIVILPLSGPEPGQARLLLLHVVFNEQADLAARLQLLRSRGPLLDRIVAAVTEHGLAWRDERLRDVPVVELFDDSGEQVTATLIAREGAAAAPRGGAP